MEIGNAIRKIRRDKDLKQMELAESVGITQSYLSGIEKGNKNPSSIVLDRIANYFKIPLAVIYWNSLEEKDIDPLKVDAFRVLKPSVDGLINEMFK